MKFLSSIFFLVGSLVLLNCQTKISNSLELITVEELRQNYLKVMAEPDFKKEFDQLLKDYVGRPTPLYFAKRLSAKYNTKIYLKREDLCH
ncbi:hypothetical protein OAP26_06345, partial [Flavobacteriaceae bacterium]|nr:hypothetical protein [Flavobacteriaceae bacterium]